MVFKNRFYTTRDYECSNIVACVADSKPVTDDDRWQEVDECFIAGLTPLWIERGVHYYGYM